MIAEYQSIAHQAGARYDGVHMDMLVQFTILSGPATGASIYLKKEEVTDAAVRNHVDRKQVEFSR